MSIKAYGTVIYTADMGAQPTVFQPFEPTRNRVIKAIRSTIIFFGDPDFSTLELEIWKLKDGLLRSLIVSSLPREKASIFTLDHAIKSVYFEFETYPSYRKETQVALVLRANDYTGTDTSHIAWVREANPFMVHSVDPIGSAEITRSPYIFSVVGDRF